MRRAGVDEALTPSLFPILSVLVCLLGSLVLIMGAVTAFALGPGRTVRVNVTGPVDVQRLSPTYVEWDGVALVLHPARERIAFDPAKATLSDAEINQVARARGDLWKNYWRVRDGKLREQFVGSGFEKLLQDGDGRYLVVLVRPSGFRSFVELRNFLIRQNVELGYEPIEPNYRVRVD